MGKVYKGIISTLVIFMGKKKNKNKKKKINPKKEKYAQFRKEKATTMTFTTAEISPEQQKQRIEDEETIGRFLRYNKNRPTKELIERKRKGRN
jgi:hypothetical protein